MDKTKKLTINIEPRIEEQAELVLGRLGIPVSVAVNMFLKQVVIQKRIPFEVTLSTNHPIDTSTLNDEELDIEIEKGYADFLQGNTKHVSKTFSDIRDDYGI